MILIQKIRASFTTQLSLWVSVFVLIIIGLVIFLLARFSQEVIHDETIDATRQALENTALRIDNTLRLADMAARQEHKTTKVDRALIEQLIEENGYFVILRQSLPNARFSVADAAEAGEPAEGEYSFYQPIGGRSIGLMVVCPASDIYGKYSRMQWLLLVSGVIGVLVLLYIIYYIVGVHLRPLHLLADAAQGITDGHLNTPIPDTHHIDETGRLQNSLSKMQTSLAAYMDEMLQKQSTLSRQNEELQAAYGEAQAYEAMKAKFLRDMTAQMAAPVDTICHSTDSICRNYLSLTKAQMAHQQLAIMQATETIIRLLDQLMNNTPATPPTITKNPAAL